MGAGKPPIIANTGVSDAICPGLRRCDPGCDPRLAVSALVTHSGSQTSAGEEQGVLEVGRSQAPTGIDPFLVLFRGSKIGAASSRP